MRACPDCASPFDHTVEALVGVCGVVPWIPMPRHDMCLVPPQVVPQPAQANWSNMVVVSCRALTQEQTRAPLQVMPVLHTALSVAQRASNGMGNLLSMEAFAMIVDTLGSILGRSHTMIQIRIEHVHRVDMNSELLW